MKKNILFATCLASTVLMICSNASAASRNKFYVAVPFGYSFVNNSKSSEGSLASTKLKNTPMVGLAAGYDFGEVRTEISVGYRNNMRFTINDVVSTGGNYGIYSSMSVKAYSFMVDLYKDFDIGSEFTPYIGLGLGFTNFKTGDYTFSRYLKSNNQPFGKTATSTGKSSTSFSWRIGLGMHYKLSESVDFGLGYAYNDFGKVTRNDPNGILRGTGTTNKVKFKSNEILATIKFKF